VITGAVAERDPGGDDGSERWDRLGGERETGRGCGAMLAGGSGGSGGRRAWHWWRRLTSGRARAEGAAWARGVLGRRLGRARRGLSAEENWAAALGPVRSCAGCLGQGGLGRRWAWAGKGRKVGPDRAEREIGCGEKEWRRRAGPLRVLVG